MPGPLRAIFGLMREFEPKPRFGVVEPFFSAYTPIECVYLKSNMEQTSLTSTMMLRHFVLSGKSAFA